MIEILEKKLLIESFSIVVNKIINKVYYGYFDTFDKKTKLSEALTSINQAILETRKFIKNQGYDSNTELSKLWHDALNKSIAAGLKDELPDFLYHKANFWGEPSVWLENKTSLEIIPKLNDLKKKCDEILVMINNKY